MLHVDNTKLNFKNMETKNKITKTEYDRIILEDLIPILHSKFEESYPDTFVKCNTRDKEIYESANGCMYNWFIKIINEMYGGHFSPKYTPKFSDELLTCDYSIIYDFINDLNNSDNWQSFIIENVNIGFN